MNHTLRSAPLLALAMLALEGCDTAPRLLGDGPVALEGVDMQFRAEARFAGDIDGDGYDDVLVTHHPNDPQHVEVLMGRPGVDVLTADALASGEGGLVVHGRWAVADAWCEGSAARDRVEAAPLGDVDGDGLADFAVLEQLVGETEARITVVFGTAARGELDLETVGAGVGGYRIDLLHSPPHEEFGVTTHWTMTPLGDVSGDGHDDLLVRPVLGPNSGGLIVLGKADGAPIEASVIDGIDPAHGLRFDNELLGDVRGLGDFDGDGHDDLALASWTGDVLVFRGGPMADLAFPGEDAWLTIERPDIEFFSVPVPVFALERAGDVDGDGLSDLLLGLPTEEEPIIYVVHGTSEGGMLTHAGLQAGEGGFAVHGLEMDFAGGGGDIDGDGLDDLLLTMPNGTWSDDDPGGVIVTLGRVGTEATSLAALSSGEGGFRVAQEPELRAFGQQVDGGGDFNGDGLDDLIIIARTGDAEQSLECDDGLTEGRVLIRFAPQALP